MEGGCATWCTWELKRPSASLRQMSQHVPVGKLVLVCLSVHSRSNGVFLWWGSWCCLETVSWCACLIPLQIFNTGTLKIYSTAQCESCSENVTWKGMLLGSLAVLQIGCQILLLDLREFSCCLHFSGSLKSTCSFLYIKVSTWHRTLAGIYERA